MENESLPPVGTTGGPGDRRTGYVGLGEVLFLLACALVLVRLPRMLGALGLSAEDAGLTSLAVWAVALYFLVRLLGSSNRVWRRDRNGYSVATCTLRAAPDGLHISNGDGESRVAWHAVLHVGETRNHIFLHLDPMNAYAIPKSNFSCQAAASDFLSSARRYMAEAREPTK